jgi:hypothetical protein
MQDSARKSVDAARCALAVAAFALLQIASAADLPQTTITVEAPRDHATVERDVRTFVDAIVVKAGGESLARWQSQIPLCPLVAGMPGSDGEYFLSRISKAAAAAGAPLAPANCKGNYFIVFTSDPEGVIKAWSKRDVHMFDDETDQGGTKIREFNAPQAVHVWYNAVYYQQDGTPLGNAEGRTTTSADATRLETNNFRALSSVMAVVDTRRMKGVSFGQVAAYLAMVGLVEIRPQANVSDTPTVLNMFLGIKRPPTDLTAWDMSFLKAAYRTRITDKAQLAAIRTAMVQDIAH